MRRARGNRKLSEICDRQHRAADAALDMAQPHDEHFVILFLLSSCSAFGGGHQVSRVQQNFKGMKTFLYGCDTNRLANTSPADSSNREQQATDAAKVAYSISAGRCDSSKPGKKSVMQVRRLTARDDSFEGRAGKSRTESGEK